jgi:hypothetical protein
MIDGLVALQSSVDAARCALRVTSKPVANVISARATLTNAALVYLTTETKCVKFLKGRVEAAKVEIGKLEQEFSRYCTCTWGFQAPGCWGWWDVFLASVFLPAPESCMCIPRCLRHGERSLRSIRASAVLTLACLEFPSHMRPDTLSPL